MKALLERLSTQSEIHLIFDFDGTLIPIRDDRADLSLPDLTRKTLCFLTDYPTTILSGRKEAELKAAFTGFSYNFVARNGFEETAAFQLEGARIRECLSGVLSCPETLGTVVEEKGALTALHYRHLKDPRVGPFIEEATRQVLGELGYLDRWHVYGGKMVVNIEPKVASKGDFVSRYLASFPGASVLFAGDDRNDYPVFELDHPRLFKVFIESPLAPQPVWWSTVTVLPQSELMHLLAGLMRSK